MATYGSMNEEKGPLVGFKDSHKIEMEESFDPNNPFNKNFDENFWIKVILLSVLNISDPISIENRFPMTRIS